MNLKELKKMIAEEYNAFQEQNALPTVNVSDKDIDATDENAEETLRDIYNMLKDFFEGGKADDKDTDDADDADDKEDDAMDEQNHSHGMYDEDEKNMKKEGKHKDDDDKKEESKHLQERFKRLANIIK